MLVRQARNDEGRQIAALKIASWQAAYAGLLPGAFLDSMDLDEHAGIWSARIAGASSDPISVVLVAEGDDGALWGFATAAAATDEDATPDAGELTTLYLHPEVWHAGVGRQLHDAALDHLASCGFLTARVWMLGTNDRAGAFYRRQGWVEDGTTRTQVVGGQLCHDVRFSRPLASESPSFGS